MMWRVARLNSDGALAPETDGSFEQVLAGPAAAEISLLGRLKQHLCSDENLADQLQSGNTEALAGATLTTDRSNRSFFARQSDHL
jgi:hypothetical protein